MGRACFALTFPKCKLLYFPLTVCAKNTSPLNKWTKSLSESSKAVAFLILVRNLELWVHLFPELQRSTESKEQEPKKQNPEIEKVNTSTQSCSYMQRSIACEKSGKNLALPILLLLGQYESTLKEICKQKHSIASNAFFILYKNHQIGYLLFIPNGGNQ
mgnify:CR=1 FL=1